MYLFSKPLAKKSYYFNLLLSAMPISFIAGNMIIFYNLAPVAQLDRALGYGPGGSGFDS